MKAENFAKILNADFYTGGTGFPAESPLQLPDAHLWIDPKHHVIAANEGNCTALAAGYHLAYRQSPGSLYAEQRRRQYHQPRGIPAER